MIADEFKRDIGAYLQTQSRDLLAKQLSVSKAVYTERTGSLNRALSSSGTVIMDPDGLRVELAYPMHIRFLDLKRSARKSRTTVRTAIRDHRKVKQQVRVGTLKQHYAPIYNKYVYGYLKSSVYKRLRRVIPRHLILEWSSRMGAVL